MDRIILAMKKFVINSWLAYTGLFAWISPHGYIAAKIISPIGQMLFFVLLGVSATGKSSVSFYIIGNAIQMAALNGIFGVTNVVGGERRAGTLIYLLGSPADRLSVFVGKAFFNIMDGILTVVICLSVGLLIGLDLSNTNPLILFLTILVSSFSACGFGLLIGSFCLLSVNSDLMSNTFFTLLLIFSGANLPYDKMPSWIHTVGTYLPLSHGIQSARLLVEGASFIDVWLLLVIETGIGLIYTFLGLIFFKSLELLARHKGTLEYI